MIFLYGFDGDFSSGFFALTNIVSIFARSQLINILNWILNVFQRMLSSKRKNWRTLKKNFLKPWKAEDFFCSRKCFLANVHHQNNTNNVDIHIKYFAVLISGYMYMRWQISCIFKEKALLRQSVANSV